MCVGPADGSIVGRSRSPATTMQILKLSDLRKNLQLGSEKIPESGEQNAGSKSGQQARVRPAENTLVSAEGAVREVGLQQQGWPPAHPDALGWSSRCAQLQKSPGGCHTF